MSMANEFYARFAAEERVVELRSEAQAWRLARAAAGRRCPPAYRLRLFMTRVTAASRQALRAFAPGSLAPGSLTPRTLTQGDSTPRPCGC